MIGIRRNKKEATRESERSERSERPSSWQPLQLNANDRILKRHSFAQLRHPQHDASGNVTARSDSGLPTSPSGGGHGDMQFTSNSNPRLSSHASFQNLHNPSSASHNSGSHGNMAERGGPMMASAMSWHGGPGDDLSAATSTNSVNMPPNLQPRIRKGMSFDNMDHNLTPRRYHSQEGHDQSDVKPMMSHSMLDMRQVADSPGHPYRPQYSPRDVPPQSRSRQRYNNYENVEEFAGKLNSGSSATSPLSPDSGYASSSVPPARHVYSKPRGATNNPSLPKTLMVSDLDLPPPPPESPPAPPVRDASSLKYVKSQNHEKSPSWPVANNANFEGAKSSNSVRTNSWSPSTTTSNDFPKKPKVAYLPQLNPTAEENNLASIKKTLQEDKLATESQSTFRADFIQDALARVEGAEFHNLHSETAFPIDSKGEVEIKNLFNAHKSYPYPVYDRDGRGMGDKDYSVPSPPERDLSDGKRDRIRRSDSGQEEKVITEMPMLDELLRQFNEKSKGLNASPLTKRSSPTVTPPPLPNSSPPPLPTNAATLAIDRQTSRTSEQTFTIPKSPQHSSYTYIARNIPYYNTSTQTDDLPSPVSDQSISPPPGLLRDVQIQVDMDLVITQLVPPSPMNTLERKRCKTSDVHTQVAEITTALNAWKDGSASSSAYPTGLSQQNRHSPLANKLEHVGRIPETINEVSREGGKTEGRGLPPKYKRESDMHNGLLNQIHDHSPSQTSMLRQLSREMFGNQARAGYGFTSRRGHVDRLGAVSEIPNKHERGGSLVESSWSSESASPSPRQLPPSSQSASQLSLNLQPVDERRQSYDNHENRSTSQHAGKDYWSDTEVFQQGPSMGSSRGSISDAPTEGSELAFASNGENEFKPRAFKGERSKKLSLKKAFGIFEEMDHVEGKQKQSDLGGPTKSKSISNVYSPEAQKPEAEQRTRKLSLFSSKKKNKPPKSEIAKLDLAVDPSQLPEEGQKLKRTSSEQLRPQKKKDREQAKDRHKMSDPETSAQLHRRKISEPVIRPPPKRLSDPSDKSRRSSDQDLYNWSSSASEHRISSGSESLFTGISGESSHPASARSISSSSSMDDSHRLFEPELKKQQQQAVLHFWEKKTGNRLSVSSMESSGTSSDRTTPKDRIGSVSPAYRESDRSPSPPPSETNQFQNAMRKSKSLPRDMVEAGGLSEVSRPDSSKTRERRQSGGTPKLLVSHKKERSAPSHLECYGLTTSDDTTNWRGGPVDTIRKDSVQHESSQPEPMVPLSGSQESANETQDSDPSQKMLRQFEYSSSSSNNSSPTKTPAHDYTHKQFSYQVTAVNSSVKDGEDSMSPPPLPARNYRSNNKNGPAVQKERYPDYKPPPKPEFKSPMQPNASFVNNLTTDFDQTPKADYYADQLRQQARRISSQGTILNPVRMQYHSKAAQDLKMSVSSSRPVDRPPIPQEAKAPHGLYKTVEIPSNLSFPSPDETNSASSSQTQSHSNSNSPAFTNSANGKAESMLGDNEDQSLPSSDLPPQLPSSAPPAEVQKVEPLEDLPPQPPPPLPDEIVVSDSRKQIQVVFDEDQNADPNSDGYGGDSYMQYRQNTRQGFSGNYRRSGGALGSTSPPMTSPNHPGPDAATPPTIRTDNFMKVGSAEPANKTLQFTEAKAVIEHGPVRSPTSEQQPEFPTLNNENMFISSAVNNYSDDYAYNISQANANSTSEEAEENPSVRDVISNFENKDRKPHASSKPQVTRSKVSELKHNLLRRSNENLLNIDSGSESDRDPLSRSSPIPNQHTRSTDNLSGAPPLPQKQYKTSHERLNEIANSYERRSPNHSFERIGGQHSPMTRSQERLNDFRPGFIQGHERRQSHGQPHDRKASNHLFDRRGSEQHVTPPSQSYDRRGSDHHVTYPSQSYDRRESDHHVIYPNQSYERKGSDHHAKPISQSQESMPSNQHQSHSLSGQIERASDSTQVPNQELSPGQSEVRPVQMRRSLPQPESEAPSLPPKTVIAHQRQKSQEEIDYEEQAAIVARQIRDADKRLSDVILPPPELKQTMDYVGGIFDTNVDTSRRPSLTRDLPLQFTPTKSSSSAPSCAPFWSPSDSSLSDCKTEKILKDLGIAENSLQRQKEELESRIKRKLEILRDERESIKTDIASNNELGAQIHIVVESKCQTRAEIDKYKLYVDELDKVMYLLLKISGRLARADNALLALPEDAPVTQKADMMGKCSELKEKLEDAKQLKEGIDRRSKQVAVYLRKYLTDDEFLDYEHFVKNKARMTLSQQELEDKISLGEEQLKALQKSMSCSTA